MTKDLSIENLCGGAVQERINRALKKVSDNILDPNTNSKKKRSLSIVLTFIPDEDDREDCTIEANVSMKLVPEEGVKSQLYISKDLRNGIITITEHVKGQIKGQMSFDDLGFAMDDTADTADTAEDLGCDPETGEIIEKPDKTEIVDFRKVKEG